MDDRVKAAFDAASESVKQVLALGTASIGAAIALFDDDKTPGVNLVGSWAIYAGLVLLALSVMFGVLALCAIAGQLGSTKTQSPSTYSTPVRLMAGAELIFYGLGILLLVLAVFL